jgi:broad specificity phosphatase PhoE
MVCRVYLVRHGETEWNATRKVQGHSDVSLSEKGREQARLLSKRLASEKFDCFYSSDLDRAVETARILAAPHNLDVNVTSDLRELNFGTWEGMHFR